MAHHPHLLPQKFSRQKHRHPSRRLHQQRGVSIVEVLVSAVILTLGLAGVAAMSTVANRASQNSGLTSTQRNLIDAELAEIRKLAETLTWCTGAGAFSCTGQTPRTQNYYSPATSTTCSGIANCTVNGATQIAAFTAACNDTANGSLVTPLVTAINNRAAIPGVIRVVSRSPADLAANRLAITLTGNGVNRFALIYPTVAGWCP